jgi:hydroxyacylglutathione hydrolase
LGRVTDVQPWADGSLRIRQSRIYQTNAGIFMRDGEAYAVDPSIFADEIDALAGHIRDSGSRLRGIILTHSHWDHILGPERMPGVPVIAHAMVADHLGADSADVARLVAQRLAANGSPRQAEFIPPQIDVMVTERMTLPFAGGSLRFFHAPGHCSDQLVVYESRERTLWAADMLSDVEIPFIEDVAAYRQTLEHIMTLDIAVLVPGHGTPTADPVEIKERIASDHAYLVELERAAAGLIGEGRTLENVRQALGDRPVRNPEVNAKEHLRNIETVYQALTR